MNNQNIKFPADVIYIINTLEKAGFEAYAVGGCVRDSLLGRKPNDWDICTSAVPSEVQKVFRREHIIKTGLKHGTLTLIKNRKQYEITTYRIDGKYLDNRRPEKVEFVHNLQEDLSRRDFTINAMAANPKTGIVDFFGGKDDLKNGIIKCVGDPKKRFNEDVLRIMRALRFSCVFDFSIEQSTQRAMIENRNLFKNIAYERISAELNKLLLGKNICQNLNENMDVLTEIIPEFKPCIGFNQHNPYHCFDVLTHILKSVEAAPKDLTLRLTMLFHDIEKPACYIEKDGIGHFYGHAEKSAKTAEKILRRLRYDNKITKEVVLLILNHDKRATPSKKLIRRKLNKIGEQNFRRLLKVQQADDSAKSDYKRNENPTDFTEINRLLEEIIEQNECFTLKDLAVNGRDIIALGISDGEKIGHILNELCGLVVDGEVENDREKLLKKARVLHNRE